MLINPKFQLTLIAYAASMALIILVSVYSLIRYGFQRFIDMGIQEGLPLGHQYFSFIQIQQDFFNQILLAIGIVVGISLILAGVVISHKIAGPIYRMQKELARMRESNPPKMEEIQFRKGDFFPELAESFNSFVRKWKA